MSFLKKIIILNEVTKGYGKSELRGLATVEKNSGKAVCRLTVFNLHDIKPGTLVFGIKSRSMRLQKFDLAQTSQNFSLDRDTDLEGVISCILAYKKPERAVPLLWGSTDGKKIFEGNMTDGFTEKAAEPAAKESAEPPREPEHKEETAETGKEGAVVETAAAAAREEYQDYAVAAENYYPQSYDTADREPPIFAMGGAAEKENPEAADAAEFSSGEGESAPQADAGHASPEVKAAPETGSETEPNAAAEEKAAGADGGESGQAAGKEAPEGAAQSAGEVYTFDRGLKGGKFYTSIKSQLDELFDTFPKEEYLCSLLKGTDWVKVDYDNNGQYYTVGIIAEEDLVKYICYGVPGKYAKTPPQELKGFCQWLPFDFDNPEAEGYWMMYQDAENGKSVTLEMI